MLDFYLLGIARSGTSVSQKVLSLHPKVFCGFERFPADLHPKLIKFPESFLDSSISGNPYGLSNAKSILSNMSDSELKASYIVGDKLPRKFYVPSHLNAVKTNLFIYRSYKQTCLSWDIRANNEDDHSWSRHCTGLFYFFDLIVFFFFANRILSLHCVDYKSCYYGNSESELAIWFNGLGLSLDEYPLEAFSEKFLRDTFSDALPSLDKRYEEFANFINLPNFEKAYASSTSNAERVKCVNEYSQHIRNNHIVFMNKLFSFVERREYEELLNITSIIEKNFTKEEKSLFIHSELDLKLFFQDDEKSIKKLINIIPNNSPKLKIKLSHHLQRNGNLAEAIKEVQEAIEMNPEFPTWHNRLASLLMKHGKLNDAEKASKVAISLKPNESNFYIMLSHIYMRNNKLGEAIKAVNMAIAINPDVPSWHRHLKHLLTKSKL